MAIGKMNNAGNGLRFWTLDAMRGVAAIMVVLSHFSPSYARHAYLAVDFFFMLSGFVIAQAYRNKLREGLGVRAFIRARLRRLFPLYAAGIIIGLLQLVVLIFLALRHIQWTDLFVSTVFNLLMLPSPTYFFVQNPMQGLFPIDGPAWSMFWELVVNIIFALLLFRLRVRYLLLISIFSFIGLALAATHYDSLNIGWEWPSWYAGLLRVMFAFPVGLILHSLLIDARWRRRHWLVLVPIIALAFFLVIPWHGE
jgi:peptidoglycan/LPS O-acetylase OafA/YrhL